MKQDKDWIDAMRSSLRDAETPPPLDGWARLERELGVAPAPRTPVWRIHGLRIAAAAAAVVVCFVTGEILWNADRDTMGYNGNVITEAVSGGAAVAPIQNKLGSDAAATPEALEIADAAVARAPRRGVAKNLRSVAAIYAAAEQPAVQSEVVADVVAQDHQESDAQPVTTSPQPQRSSSETTTRKQQPQTASLRTAASIYTDDFVAAKPKHKKTSFSLFGGGAVTSTGAGGVAPGLSASMSDSPLGMGDFSGGITLMRQFDYARGSFRHHQPLSFGLSVRKEFAYGLSLESGVNYTFLSSDVSLFSGSEPLNQKLHFIGVPLRVNWQFFERGRFSLYIGAGGMVEKCLSARYDSRSVDEPKVQWSALAAAGAQYRLGGTVGLYFEPEASYYFTQTQLRTSRTDSPLTLTLRMGVRLSF